MKNINIAKKSKKNPKHFNENSIMTQEEEEEEEEDLFPKSNYCWICKKLIDNDEGKVRDQGAAHKSCNLIFQLTKKVLEIFHNLRGYDSHFIFNELDIFDIKIMVIPNGLEKYVTFFWNKNLVFIDSMQFMNSSHDKLAKNLSDNDFKYLIGEFCSLNLELSKQKGTSRYEYIDSFERFNEEKLPNKKQLHSSIKNGKIGDDGTISDGHIDVNDYLTCKKSWDKFEMKNKGDYHDHYLKKDALLLADVFEKFIGTCLKYYGLDP